MEYSSIPVVDSFMRYVDAKIQIEDRERHSKKKYRYINTSFRVYPDGTVQVRIFPNGLKVLDEVSSDAVSKYASDSDESIRISSFRSKMEIFDIARSNHWDYFVTLTLDKQQVDRYDYDAVVQRMQTFTKYLRRHRCEWLIVPELHKDGAFHFHGLLHDPGGNLTLKYWGQKHTKSGEWYDEYDLVGYSLGFTSVSKVRDQARVSNYITKYTTKELLKTVPKGRKRYWSSRGLLRPKKEDAELSPKEFDILKSLADYESTYRDPVGNEIVLLEIENVKGR